MTLDEYRLQYLKWHGGYERRAYKIFRKAMKQTVERVPIDNITYSNYRVIIPLNIHIEYMRKAYEDVYMQVGLIHGNRIGRGINRELKDFSLPFFNEEFQRQIIEWVRFNMGSRIVSVTDTIAKRIMRLVDIALGENLSIQDMQAFIRKNISKSVISRYDIMRIARTETGGAANHAATVAARTSGIVLDKVWISSHDNRTRRKPRNQFDHFEMNGVSVDELGVFTLTSTNGTIDRLEFPCAPNGSAGNVIQCRCAVAYRPKRDADGFVIRK